MAIRAPDGANNDTRGACCCVSPTSGHPELQSIIIFLVLHCKYFLYCKYFWNCKYFLTCNISYIANIFYIANISYLANIFISATWTCLERLGCIGCSSGPLPVIWNCYHYYCIIIITIPGKCKYHYHHHYSQNYYSWRMQWLNYWAASSWGWA